ncbi:MAG: galactose oxidase-like domain-containing protein [Acidimicrobiales bacterium]
MARTTNLSGHRGRLAAVLLGLSALTLVALGAFSQAGARTTATQTTVVMHADPNFGGASWSLSVGTYDFPAINSSPIGNDAISSMTIPVGFQVRACLHGGGAGTCLSYTESIAQLTTLDNAISFLQVSAVANPANTGRWGPVIDTPLVPVAASALPNGKVLMWSAYAKDRFGGNRGYTQTALFDPNTNSSSVRQVSNTGHDMFCPGIANLADGRILVNGGSNAGETSIYNPETDSWENADDMRIPRAYNGTTLLSDGSAFTLGGSWAGGRGGKNGERWTAEDGWQRLDGVPAAPFEGQDPSGVLRSDNHMWLFGWKDGTVFHAGPSRNMNWIDTSGSGSYTPAGRRSTDPYAINGSAVMYAPGKILTTGGAPSYENGNNPRANATVIDINDPTVVARRVESMDHRRVFQSSTVLANGEVLIAGGQSLVAQFSDERAVLTPELWNPDTETFRPLEPMAVPRTYHSVGLLMPDARVLVGGGGLCGNCGDNNHADVQLFSPPYLYNDDGSLAARPDIVAAPSSVDLNELFPVTTDRAVNEFALIRSSSATHAVNNDQRRIPLEAISTGNNGYKLQMPADGGIAIPGSYMLFALDAQGVPSVAAVLTVTTDTAPVIVDTTIDGVVTQEDGTLREGVQVDLFEQSADGSRGTYLASTTTDAEGRYEFEVEQGCYALTFVAPEDETFDGQSWFTGDVCLDAEGQSTELNPVLDDPPTGLEPTIKGTVSLGDGSPAAEVSIDLFAEGAGGGRGQYLASTSTAADGSYEFLVQPGCYILTMIAPGDATFNGSQYFQPGTCLDEGQSVLDATLTANGEQASIGGTVTEANGVGVPGAFVDLFTATADGSRGEFVTGTQTDSSGRYRFDSVPDCYILTFIAPGDNTYDGSRWLQAPQCVEAGDNVTDLNATLDPR